MGKNQNKDENKKDKNILVIRIDSNGNIYFIDKPEFSSLKNEGKFVTQRASHVEPANRVLRWLFHVLRRWFGENGAVAAFTRRWPCAWRVNLTPSGGGILDGVYRNRQDAIEAEVQWLQTHKLGRLAASSPSPSSGV